ncbi:aspartate carbamoyltransferase catalytic subunit [Apilactobacillus micheneri]|uniref:Aspartate carbamoyltransferase n=1 Tax=Apilactobacillus micheneri TaxID=1899430 RepID=A0ABY2YW12_9LACO|nr:aspartate carbamoyltransferase catalytic subunit [Apilactobacillus micheneri]TPR24529.1 aspartate carbamoyltransferase catalytic subunit [Apilactobacillus micheneri]TPR25840.1 aspartate carbamoyltransferase catalytic subunit [Apilactobacillus micheneri]TPR28030.1 aspartate carbamoyltransferase catalytic subunit [Apilactobacillus micheneri]TPR29521.1 aspartate carbamoyltransferase catalytic subunit [Apilactobacillus micheneri]TPR30307.1 aspartate carbamoyltransferase catalytic subunit [Apila
MTLDMNFLNINEFSNDEIKKMILLAHKFRNGKQIKFKKPIYAANLFFENSTRTHTSFEMAQRKLGIQTFNINPQTSSMKKGESLSDTIKTLQAIGMDCLVIRHKLTGWYQELSKDPNINISLVNAGDGSGQHPSQSLLDLVTIDDEFHKFAGLSIGIIGDLVHSRVARSDAEILQRLGANIYFAGPKAWYPKDFDKFGTYVTIDEIIDKLDVVMMLRVQLERLNHELVSKFTNQNYFEDYGLTKQRAAKMKNKAIIMHPAPVNRDVEIASQLVESSNSRIFRQMNNGVYARMAILITVLNKYLEDK